MVGCPRTDAILILGRGRIARARSDGRRIMSASEAVSAAAPRLVRMAENRGPSVARCAACSCAHDRRDHVGRPRDRAAHRRLRSRHHRAHHRRAAREGRPVPHDRPARSAADAEGDARGALREVRHDAAAHRAPGRRARRRRERRRQDDDDRQVREVPAALRTHGRRRRGRHLPRGGGRPARDVGGARAEPRSSGRSRRARIRHPSPSRRSSTPSAPAPRSCWSTPPAACTPRAG